MKLQMERNWFKAVFVTLLALAAAIFFIRPAYADTNSNTAVSAISTVQQANAPNASTAIGTVQSNDKQNQQLDQENAQSQSKPTTAGTTTTTVNTQQEKSTDSQQSKATTTSTTTTAADTQQAKSTASQQPTVRLAAAPQAKATAPGEVTPTSTTVKVINTSTGKEYNGETIDQYTPLKLQFAFDFQGQNVQNGDYFNFTIDNPNNYLKLADGQSVTIPLMDGNNQLGTATLTVIKDKQIAGKVTLAENGSDAKGYFEFTLAVDASQAGDSKEIPVKVIAPNISQPQVTIKYVSRTVNPNEEFSKYSYNNTSYSINISFRILLLYNLFSGHRMITSNYHWLWSTGIG